MLPLVEVGSLTGAFGYFERSNFPRQGPKDQFLHENITTG
jgi:hypothetical protein